MSKTVEERDQEERKNSKRRFDGETATKSRTSKAKTKSSENEKATTDAEETKPKRLSLHKSLESQKVLGKVKSETKGRSEKSERKSEAKKSGIGLVATEDAKSGEAEPAKRRATSKAKETKPKSSHRSLPAPTSAEDPESLKLRVDKRKISSAPKSSSSSPVVKRKVVSAKSGVKNLSARKIKQATPSKSVAAEEDDDDDDDDFEEVEENENPEAVVAAFEGLSNAVEKTGENDGGVEITLSAEDLKRVATKKPTSKEEDWEKHFESLARKHKKEVREGIHNVHLLCLMARGFYLSSQASTDDALATALSVIPPDFLSHRIADYNPYQLSRVYNWFSRKFRLEVLERNPFEFPVDVAAHFASKSAPTPEAFIIVFLSILRCIGFDARLLISLEPVPLKPIAEKKSGEEEANEGGKNRGDTKNRKSKGKTASKTGTTSKPSRGKKETSQKVGPVSKNRDKKPGKSSTSIEVDEIFDDGDEEASSGAESDVESREGNNVWVEAFLPSDRRWVSMDPINRSFDSPADLESSSPSKFRYVVGFGPGMRHAKDLTCKYAAAWMTNACRKRRTDPDWWLSVMEEYRQPDHLEVEENMKIQRELVSKPMPASISEFKNHPLFALRRHLLKFEAIYPDDQRPLGVVKGEPVFPRSSVKELMSHFKWREKARLVRLEEKPYKIVKARPRFFRVGPGEWKKEEEPRDLELFGKWQTEPYIARPVVDGKVPRNEYGNVELFKKSMLPGGSIYLEGMPGLNSVAGKLGIDCAPAMTGFDFHGGRAHPVLEGWVVATEFAETLTAAWDEAQSAKAEKQKEKKMKRALDNWRLLVRGLFIREKLNRRYKDPTDVATGIVSVASKKSGAGGSKPKVDENQWMTLKNPRLGKEEKDGDLLPFERS